MKKILFFLFAISSVMAQPALVFDFDGVMTREPDKEQIYSYLRDSLHLSRSEFEEIYPIILSGQSGKEFWLALADRKKVQIIPGWGDRFKTLMKNSFVNSEMFDLVDRLKNQNVTVVLFSNMNKNQAMRFQEMGLFTSFEKRIFAYEIQTSKPDPKAYQMLLRRLGLSASDIVFIDDHPENVEMAKKMGIDAILFQSAHQIHQELENRSILHESDCD